MVTASALSMVIYERVSRQEKSEAFLPNGISFQSTGQFRCQITRKKGNKRKTRKSTSCPERGERRRVGLTKYVHLLRYACHVVGGSERE